MDLSSLNFLLAVDREGSVTAAARALHCVQSNVTGRIKQLEEEVGVALFYRVKQRLVITPAGRTLVGYAQRIHKLTEEAMAAVQEGSRPQGPLTLGAMETTAGLRLADMLAGYHHRYPDVDLAIETGTSRELIDRVLAFELDAALVGGPLQHPDIVAEPLYTEELVLITDQTVADLDALAERGPLTLLMFKRGCVYRERLEQWVNRQRVPPKRVMDFGTLEAIIGCVAAGMGVSVVPRALIERHPRRELLGVHTLPREIALTPTLLIRRADTRMSKALEAFRDMLTESAAAA